MNKFGLHCKLSTHYRNKILWFFYKVRWIRLILNKTNQTCLKEMRFLFFLLQTSTVLVLANLTIPIYWCLIDVPVSKLYKYDNFYHVFNVRLFVLARIGENRKYCNGAFFGDTNRIRRNFTFK